MSLVFVLCVCACVPTTTIYPQTQSFLFLVSRGSGRRESRLRPEGGGQGRSSAPLPRRQFPAKVRCPPRSPRCPGGGTGQPWAGGPPAGAGILGPVQPPGTWGPARVTARQLTLPTRGALGRRWVLEPGFLPTAAFLPPHPHPAPESPGAPLPGALPAGLVGHIPGSPFSGPSILRERDSGDKGAWDPSPPAGSSSRTGAGPLQMRFPDAPLCSCSSPNPVLFPREREG